MQFPRSLRKSLPVKWKKNIFNFVRVIAKWYLGVQANCNRLHLSGARTKYCGAKRDLEILVLRQEMPSSYLCVCLCSSIYQLSIYCINYTLLILTVAGFYNAIENCTILFQLFILKEKSESILLQIDTELCTQATINNRFDWFVSLPNSYYTWSSVNQPAFPKQYHFAVKLLLNKTSISTLKYFYVARCVRVTISR